MSNLKFIAVNTLTTSSRLNMLDIFIICSFQAKNLTLYLKQTSEFSRRQATIKVSGRRAMLKKVTCLIFLLVFPLFSKIIKSVIAKGQFYQAALVL